MMQSKLKSDIKALRGVDEDVLFNHFLNKSAHSNDFSNGAVALADNKYITVTLVDG